jgi:hypothetical protein
LNISTKRREQIEEMIRADPDSDTSQAMQELLEDLLLVGWELSALVTGVNYRREDEGLGPFILKDMLAEAKKGAEGYHVHVLMCADDED